jgi:hypothetical protein
MISPFSCNGPRAGRWPCLHDIVERPDRNSTNRPRHFASSALQNCLKNRPLAEFYLHLLSPVLRRTWVGVSKMRFPSGTRLGPDDNRNRTSSCLYCGVDPRAVLEAAEYGDQERENADENHSEPKIRYQLPYIEDALRAKGESCSVKKAGEFS